MQCDKCGKCSVDVAQVTVTIMDQIEQPLNRQVMMIPRPIQLYLDAPCRAELLQGITRGLPNGGALNAFLFGKPVPEVQAKLPEPEAVADDEPKPRNIIRFPSRGNNNE